MAGHTHDRYDTSAVPARTRRVVWSATTVVLTLLAFLVSVTWPTHDTQVGGYPRIGATVVAVERVACGPNRCVEVEAAIDGGRRVALGVVGADTQLGRLGVGSAIVLGVDTTRDTYFYVDVERRGQLGLLGLVFAACVIGLARWRGVRALLGLCASAAIVFYYTAPALLQGRDPVLVCALSAAVIAVVSVGLLHGISTTSFIGGVSILASLAVAWLVGAVVFPALELTGGSDHVAGVVAQLTGGIDLRGLLLGGALLGAVGTLDDIVLTQVAAVAELSCDRDRRGAVRGALSIGRAHVGAAVNTLALAYLGASMPLVLIYAAAGGPLSLTLGAEEIAAEIARTVVGSLALVVGVPIATFLAGYVYGRPRGAGAADRAGPGRS